MNMEMKTEDLGTDHKLQKQVERVSSQKISSTEIQEIIFKV